MYINEVLKNKKNSTIFTNADLVSLVDGANKQDANSALEYALRNENIIRISEGLYTYTKDYSRREFANKYRTPSYISLYTVFREAGIVFQPYYSIFAISNRSEEKEVDGQNYIYRKIKDEILLNHMGIIERDGVSIAIPERAICDKLYLDGDEYFDNLRSINMVLMKDLCEKVYENSKVINKFIEKHINENT